MSLEILSRKQSFEQVSTLAELCRRGSSRLVRITNKLKAVRERFIRKALQKWALRETNHARLFKGFLKKMSSYLYILLKRFSS